MHHFATPLPPISDVNAAYLAGVIDSDGTIYLERAARKTGGFRYRVVLSVMMCDTPTMKFIAKVTGKKLIEKLPTNGSLTKRPMIYRLTWRNGPAEDLLRVVHPFMHNKKAQANLAFKFQQKLAKPLGVHFSDKDFTISERLYLQMKALNNPTDLRC
jgi:hypothetical protein